MNIWWVIFLAGIGTYLMRSAGVWLPPQLFQARWLNHLPLAVILVLTISSMVSLSGSTLETLATVVAGAVVAIASFKKVPLIFVWRSGVACGGRSLPLPPVSSCKPLTLSHSLIYTFPCPLPYRSPQCQFSSVAVSLNNLRKLLDF
ncbi:MAG: AzlD domain-containing protein [Leptolyngbyaceae cyanobacterium SL_5_9]|nr:AzlD domain-containing protein [Leptolyngbyaceae cyanobacterium SL_5_9]